MKKYNKHVKSLLAFALALVMLFSVCPLSGLVGFMAEDENAREGDPVFDGGYWEVYDDGEVRFIAASIPSKDPEDPVDAAPWKAPNGTNYADYITSITISDAVTTIGAYGFKDLKPAVIGIPKKVTKIDPNAFAGSKIKDVYYEGTKAQWDNAAGSISGVVVHYGHKHSKDVWKHGYAESCTKDGYAGDVYCSLCGAFVERGDAINKTPHVWSVDYKVVTKPTCSATGTEAQYCIKCGTVNYDSLRLVPKTDEHDWTVLERNKLDDCTKHLGEKITMNCRNCPATKQETVNAHGDLHYATQAPTCVVDGSTKITCSWCRFQETQVLPATQHSDVTMGEVFRYNEPATCTQPGERGTRCTVCGETLTSEIIPNNHTEGRRSGTWVTKREPDCVNDGYQWFKCDYCGEYIKDNDVYVKHVLPKTPDLHTPSRWIMTLEPECTEKGEEIKICTVPGCPYSSKTDLGKAIVKVSDRKALDEMIAVVQDTDETHYQYPTAYDEPATTVPNTNEPNTDESNTGEPNTGEPNTDESNTGESVTGESVTGESSSDAPQTDSDANAPKKRVTDVANEINLAILSIYRKYDYCSFDKLPFGAIEQMKNDLRAIFDAALEHHGERQEDDSFLYDSKEYNCVNDTSTTLIVYSQIVDKAIDLLVKKDSVINTTEEVVAILEEAWTELGNDEIANVIQNHADQIAEVTYKALAKREIEALDHNFVRCAYYFFDISASGKSQFIPAVQSGNDWYEIKEYRKIVEKDDGTGFVYEDDDTTTVAYMDIYVKLDQSGKPVADANGKLYKDDIAVDAEGNIFKIIPDTTKKHDNETPVVGYPINCVMGGGNIISQCTRCGELADPILVKKDSHDFKVKHVDPTCDEDGYGYDLEYCTVCDYEVKKITQIPLTHNYVETTVKESTCSKTGIKIKICTYCGDVKKSTYQTLALLDHTDSPVYTAPTCTEGGRDGAICSVCGRFDGVILPPLGHDYVEDVVKATCSDFGYTTATCSRCGDETEQYNIIPAFGHLYGDPEIKQPSCTRGSYTVETCKRCGDEKTYNEHDNALGHQMKTDPAVAPTCTETGLTERVYCTRPGCGYVEKEAMTVPSLGGHTWRTVTAVAPTCTKDGHEEYVDCAVCGIYQDGHEMVTIPAIGHKWQLVSGYEATCTSTGLTDGYYCPQCKTWNPPQYDTDKAPHDFGEWTVETEATPFRAGTKVHTCRYCRETEKANYRLTPWETFVWIVTHIIFFPFYILKALTQTR